MSELHLKRGFLRWYELAVHATVGDCEPGPELFSLVVQAMEYARLKSVDATPIWEVTNCFEEIRELRTGPQETLEERQDRIAIRRQITKSTLRRLQAVHTFALFGAQASPNEGLSSAATEDVIASPGRLKGRKPATKYIPPACRNCDCQMRVKKTATDYRSLVCPECGETDYAGR